MQGWLFGHEALACDATFARLQRIELDDGGAWLELMPGWLGGHARLFDQLRDGVAWREETRRMYDRMVAVPRMFAVLEAGERPPILEEMRRVLADRYGVD